MTTSTLYPDINPSLLLDFANLKKLDPRITFTRASEGRYYDGKTTAKAEENLLLNSQDYSATWTVTNLTPVTGKTAPDTTSTATEFTAGAANATLTQSVTALAADYTFSVWLRRVTGTGDIDITAHSGGTWVTQAISGTWARYTVTQTLTAGARTPGIRVVTSGDVIEVWGAQLEQRSAATAYTATTTQPITNYVPQLLTAASGVARFDHDPVTCESLGLLIEEQRTNLLTYSDDFSNAAWNKIGSSITSNTVVSPGGTLTGDSIFQDSTTSQHGITGTIVTTSGTTYTHSIFAKAGSASILQLTFGNNAGTFSGLGYVNFNLSTGAVSDSGGTIAAFGIQSVGNGWYRCYISATATASDATNNWVQIANSPTATRLQSYTGDGYSGIYIWGAQLEAGAFPTSYIPTTASQVTRSADAVSMTGTNFSSWYRQDEGTFYTNSTTYDSSDNRNIVFVNRTGTNNSDANIIRHRSGGINFAIRVGATDEVFSTSTPSPSIALGEFAKFAAAYKFNDVALTTDSIAVTTDSSASIPQVLQMLVGNTLNGTIKKIAYYPKRLTNAQLQALTK